MKRALILGIGGQDGSYLAEILLEKGYEVHGLYRRSSVDNLWRIKHIRDRVKLYGGDLADTASVLSAIYCANPDEIYNEADQDDIRWSKSIPSYSFNITASAVGRILEFLRGTSNGCKVRFFQPLSAAMFGMAPPRQNEQTPLMPMSPYACAKVAAWYLCQHYRREYGLHICCGIMFNHDSPNRSEDYLLHYLCASMVRIARGKQQTLKVSNLDQYLDIGYARDYMEAAYQIMQRQDLVPTDYCIGTEERWTIGQIVNLVRMAAEVKDVEIESNPAFPSTQGPTLVADCTKIRQSYGWRSKTTLPELVRMMVAHEREKQR